MKKAFMAIGAGIAGIGISLAMSPMAHAAGTLVIDDPVGNLTNEQTVTVTVEHPDAGKTYYVSICNGNGSTGNPACDTTTGYFASFSSTGADKTVSFQVHKTFTSAGSASHPGVAVDCGTTQCYLVAAGHGGGGRPDASAIPVTFN